MKSTLMITQILQTSPHYHNVSKQQFPILLDMLERNSTECGIALGSVSGSIFKFLGLERSW